MSDQRVGAAFRAVRVRRRWRQLDVATAAGVSRGLVSLIERGHAGRLGIDSLRAVGAVLDIRVDLITRWRGGELDRVLNASHALLADEVTRWLVGLGWEVVPEASFSVFGERGWIDLLAWHAASRSLLVIELKTTLADINELIGVMDRKVRLAPRMARDRGWVPAAVAALLVIGESPTNRRRVAAHRALLSRAFPSDGRAARRWLRNPSGKFAAITFFSKANGSSAKSRVAAIQRVRRPAAPRTRA